MALKIPTMSLAPLMLEVQLPLDDVVSGKNFADEEAIACMVAQAEVGFAVSVLQLPGVRLVEAP